MFMATVELFITIHVYIQLHKHQSLVSAKTTITGFSGEKPQPFSNT